LNDEAAGCATVHLGIDVGTASTKGVLASAGGEVIATASVSHTTENPHPGHHEHDADAVWWTDVVSIARTLTQVARDRSLTIDSVTTSAIGPCVLPVDESGRPLRKGILYGIDSRAARQISSLNASRPPGSPLFDSQSVLPKVLWIADNEPQVWSRTHVILGAAGYLTYRLTGELSIDRYEAANYAPLLEADGTWSNRGLLDHVQLPKTRWSTEIVGVISPQAAAETGLMPGTPVVCGTVDAAAEATSAGVNDVGSAMVMLGSTGFFIAIDDGHHHPAGYWRLPFLSPGSHALAGGTNTLGTLTSWFRDTLAPDLAARERSGAESAFASLSQLGETAPAGSNGILLLPYFMGERTPINDPTARGAIVGLTLTSSRADLYRAMIEGIAYSVRDNLEQMLPPATQPWVVRVVGGGARNPLLVRSIADVSGLPMELPKETIGASLGDAIRGAAATGQGASLATINQQVPIARSFLPDPNVKEMHDRRFSQFKELYSATREIIRHS
jgi:xylulokinase